MLPILWVETLLLWPDKEVIHCIQADAELV